MKTDDIIELWLECIKHEDRDIYNFELAVGVDYVNNLRKLVGLSKQLKDK